MLGKRRYKLGKKDIIYILLLLLLLLLFIIYIYTLMVEVYLGIVRIVLTYLKGCHGGRIFERI